MPKMKPDRDDARGGLGGNGGPQDGPIATERDETEKQQGGNEGGGRGEGGQRHPGGSSRD